jgi:hypothetical protein
MGDSRFGFSCAVEARCCHKSSNLISNLRGGSSFERRYSGLKCCLCISIIRMDPSFKRLYHISLRDGLDTIQSTHYPPGSSNNCLVPFNLLSWSNFLSCVSEEPSAPVEYLMMNDRGNLASSWPMNSEHKNNHLSSPID